jgi:hypothetical protein
VTLGPKLELKVTRPGSPRMLSAVAERTDRERAEMAMERMESDNIAGMWTWSRERRVYFTETRHLRELYVLWERMCARTYKESPARKILRVDDVVVRVAFVMDRDLTLLL